MIIRPERSGDEAPISDLTTRAFHVAEHSSGEEARIVQQLRLTGTLALSLVAEDKADLIGHVAFSPVLIAGRDCSWFGLGPVSVAPERQKTGIGSALVKAGLGYLAGQGACGFVVLGNPAYYRRFGFIHDPHLTYANAGAYFQKLVVTGDTLRGEATYPAAFG